MALKMKRVQKGSTSSSHTTSSVPAFLTKANAEKYLKLVDYHVVQERAIDCTNLKDFFGDRDNVEGNPLNILEAPWEVNQQISEFQRRIEAYTIGITKWANEIVTTLYAEPPYFAPIFKDFYNQQQKNMLVRDLRSRLETVKDLEKYFKNQDNAQAKRREHMRSEWER
ncbi:hypothetical protein RYX36_003769 [Vicia faba]